MKTKTKKKTEKSRNENREQVRIAVESVRGGARCLWIWEKEKFWQNNWQNSENVTR